jgi:hypothetical protein
LAGCISPFLVCRKKAVLFLNALRWFTLSAFWMSRRAEKGYREAQPDLVTKTGDPDTEAMW